MVDRSIVLVDLLLQKVVARGRFLWQIWARRKLAPLGPQLYEERGGHGKAAQGRCQLLSFTAKIQRTL